MLNTTNVDSWGSSNKISRLFYITSITPTLMQDNRTIFNWVSEVIRDCLGFYDWYRKLAPLSKSIPFKTKTKRDLANRVFPRFGQLACSKFEFSLAPRYFLSLRLAVSISFLWRFLRLCDTQSKALPRTVFLSYLTEARNRPCGQPLLSPSPFRKRCASMVISLLFSLKRKLFGLQ